MSRSYLVFSMVWLYRHYLYTETHVIFINKMYNLADKIRRDTYDPCDSLFFGCVWVSGGRKNNFRFFFMVSHFDISLIKGYVIYVLKSYRYYVGVIPLCIFQISDLCGFYHGIFYSSLCFFFFLYIKLHSPMCWNGWNFHKKRKNNVKIEKLP